MGRFGGARRSLTQSGSEFPHSQRETIRRGKPSARAVR